MNLNSTYCSSVYHWYCTPGTQKFRPQRRWQMKFHLINRKILFIYSLQSFSQSITLFFRKAFRRKIYTNKIKSFIPKSKAIFSIMNIVLLRIGYTKTYIVDGKYTDKVQGQIVYTFYLFPIFIHLNIFFVYFLLSHSSHIYYFCQTKHSLINLNKK